MNRFIKYLLFTVAFLMHIDLIAQSIIKHISGDVYQVVNNVKKPIKGLNTIVNDSSILSFDNTSDYMIVEINGQKSMIKAADYKNGIQLINFNNNIEAENPSGFWSKIFDAVYNDSFDEKKEIDGLNKTRFQGTTRSIFENSFEKCKVFPIYNSKIDWPDAMKFEISFQTKPQMIKVKKELNYFNIDKHVLSNCKPCTVKVDNQERGLIEVVLINNDDQVFLESLFFNIDSEVNVEISQFCIIRIFINNNLFINANYYIDKFADNKLIEDYLIDIKLY
jgi:hypothetical protein